MRLFLFYIFFVHLSSILCIWREKKMHVNHTPNTKCHCIASSQHLSVRCCIIDFGASKYFFLEIHDSRKLYDVRLLNMPPSSSSSPPPCHILHSIIIIYTTIWLIYLSAGKQASERATSTKETKHEENRNKKKWRRKNTSHFTPPLTNRQCVAMCFRRKRTRMNRTRPKDNMWKRNEVIRRIKRIEWMSRKKNIIENKRQKPTIYNYQLKVHIRRCIKWHRQFGWFFISFLVRQWATAKSASEVMANEWRKE